MVDMKAAAEGHALARLADEARDRANAETPSDDALIKLLFYSDLAQLTMAQRGQYIFELCKSLGINPYTKPFDFIPGRDGKSLIVYANKACAAQLRVVHKIQLEVLYAGPLILGDKTDHTVYVVSVKAKLGDREDVEVGAVSLEGLNSEAKANAIMKAYTKAKRRVTLSISGLGFPDESEVEFIQPRRVGQVYEEPRRLEPPTVSMQEVQDSGGSLGLTENVKIYPPAAPPISLPPAPSKPRAS